jgi:hypothetical protein
MPYDATNHVLYGIDAHQARAYGRTVLLNYMKAQLNDSNGDFYEPLNLSPSRLVVATGVVDIAVANYDAPNNPPVILGTMGKKRPMKSGKTINGTHYDGWRHYIEATYDFQCNANEASDSNPDNDNLATIVEAEEKLAEFACSVVENGESDLIALGLHGVTIEPDEEAQRAGMGRNPHKVRFLIVTTLGYTP